MKIELLLPQEAKDELKSIILAIKDGTWFWRQRQLVKY